MSPSSETGKATPMSETYAAAVVGVLRDHFPDLADPAVEEVVTELIDYHARNPTDPFEVIVDDPASAKWRLHADNRDRSRVLLFIHRAHHSEADAELCRTVNDALRTLEA